MAMLVIACVVSLAYIYFYTPSWVQKLWMHAKAKFHCTPPMIEETFEVKVEEVLAGFQFDKAIQLRQDRQNAELWYVVEHQGKIFKIENDTKTLFLDLTDRVEIRAPMGTARICLPP